MGQVGHGSSDQGVYTRYGVPHPHMCKLSAMPSHHVYIEQTSQTYTHQSYEITCGHCPGFLVVLTHQTTSYDDARALLAQVAEVVAGHQRGLVMPDEPRT